MPELPEWKTSTEFEDVVKVAIGTREGSLAGRISYAGPLLDSFVIRESTTVSPGDMIVADASNTLYVHPSTANQITNIAPERAGKQVRMNQNSKSFEVTLADGTTLHVDANSVEETATRIKFLGNVEGVSNVTGVNEVVQSFLAASVASYRTVPAVEKDARAVGKHTYRVNMKDGSHKDVVADLVAHQNGSEHSSGRYTLATRLGQGRDSRVEFSVPETEVASIERVIPEEAAKAVSAPRDPEDGVLAAKI